jgi:hypothetical protein
VAVYFLWHYPSAGLATLPPACIHRPAFLRRHPAVTRHRALRSSDFPPLRQAEEAILRLPKINFYIKDFPSGNKLNLLPARSRPRIKIGMGQVIS